MHVEIRDIIEIIIIIILLLSPWNAICEINFFIAPGEAADGSIFYQTVVGGAWSVRVYKWCRIPSFRLLSNLRRKLDSTSQR